MPTFQDRLRLLKEECGDTQAKIASDIGITPQAFSYYMNGREPSYDVLIQIARYFHVSTDYLLGRSNIKGNIQDDSINKEVSGLEEELSLIPTSDKEKILESIKNIFAGYHSLQKNRKTQKRYIDCIWSLLGILSISSILVCDVEPLLAKSEENIVDPISITTRLVQSKAYCQFNIENFFETILKPINQSYEASIFDLPSQFADVIEKEAIKAAKLDIDSPSLDDKDKAAILRLRKIYADKLADSELDKIVKPKQD